MVKNGTLDDRYFEWLYSKIAAVSNRNPERSYWQLARQLYETEFLYFVANDDNRAGDGVELRTEFMYEEHLDEVDHNWMAMECSVLEMLVALANRASFETDEPAIEWFWRMLSNVGLRDITDDVFDPEASNFIDETITRILKRDYDRKGNGGLFPLKQTNYDQRKIELWYQLSSYILERDGELGL